MKPHLERGGGSSNPMPGDECHTEPLQPKGFNAAVA